MFTHKSSSRRTHQGEACIRFGKGYESYSKIETYYAYRLDGIQWKANAQLHSSSLLGSEDCVAIYVDQFMLALARRRYCVNTHMHIYTYIYIYITNDSKWPAYDNINTISVDTYKLMCVICISVHSCACGKNLPITMVAHSAIYLCICVCVLWATSRAERLCRALCFNLIK